MNLGCVAHVRRRYWIAGVAFEEEPALRFACVLWAWPHHFRKYHAYTPDVALLVVLLGQQYDFWRSVVSCLDEWWHVPFYLWTLFFMFLENGGNLLFTFLVIILYFLVYFCLSSYYIFLNIVSLRQASWEPKVTDFDLAIVVHYNIGGFNISMDDVGRMDKIDCWQNIIYNWHNLILFQLLARVH